MLTIALAHAATVGVSASGEALLGESLVQNFPSASVGGGVFARAPVHGPILAGVDVDYHRVAGTTASEFLWFLPATVQVGVELPVGRAAFWAAAGPTLVIWGATPTETRGIGSAGGNWGATGELGLRVPTRLYVPPLHLRDPVLQGLDLVFSGGFRWSDVHDEAQAHRDSCGNACGFDFTAVRLDAGLAARF